MDDMENETEDLEEKKRQEEEENEKKAESAKKMEEFEERLRASEEARIKAEAERDAFKEVTAHFSNPQPTNAQPSEDQWKQWEEGTGLTRQQIMTQAQISQQQIQASMKPLEDKAKQSEERAKAAETKLEALEREKKSERVFSEFYKKNPVYARHEKDINEFVSDYSEQDRSDPVKLAKILDKAIIYVKGKVGEKTMRQTSIVNSPKFENSANSANDENEEIDLSGLNESEARVIKSIIPNEEQNKLLNAYQSNDKIGVKMSSEREWEEAKPRFKQ